MATEIITSFQQVCDANGDPMSGAKVYVYDVGTTTLKTVYSDTALGTSVANPIVCDSAGRHDMRYIATGSYKIVVKTSADVTVYTRDNIDGRVPVGSGALAIANGGTGATTAGAALTALGGFTAAEGADLAADVAALAGAASSTEKTHIATGTTAQRPGSPAHGDFRRNSTIPQWEGYNGSAWKYFVTEDEIGTSGAKVGLLNASLTLSGNNTYSGTATFSNSAGIAGRNTCKAFALVGSGALQEGFNVTSVSDVGATHTVTLASAMPSINYAVILTQYGSAANVILSATISSTTVFSVSAHQAGVGQIDPGSYSFAVFSNG